MKNEGRNERDEERDAVDAALSELRSAWKSVEPPELPEEHTELDPQTRNAVEWMRAEWASLEIPEPSVPSEINHEESEPLLQGWEEKRTLSVALVGLAAAALLFIALRGNLKRTTPALDPLPLETTQASPKAVPSLPQEDMATEEAASTNAVQLAKAHVSGVGDNHIELRSGPVTLVLVTGKPETN